MVVGKVLVFKTTFYVLLHTLFWLVIMLAPDMIFGAGKTYKGTNARHYGERQEYYVSCRLYDEKIDRSRREEERKCFYECSDKETVVVTTSIGYPCQNSITEKRKP